MTKLDAFKELVQRFDRDGNRLIVTDNGLVYVDIEASNRRPKHIGHVFQEGDRIIYEKWANKKKHLLKSLHKGGPAWCINHTMLHVLAMPEFEGRIWIRTSNSEYYHIRADVAAAEGQYLWYKGKGCERQIGIPLDAWAINSPEVRLS